jgi:Zn-dependent peptidase ImmA (M78 family)/transcriptional regulator with XRE-family HTH domain
MNLNTLSQNTRRLRVAQRLSQKELAERSGISVPAIKNLETAKNEPRMNTVQAIARALQVPLKDLFVPVRELRTVRFRSTRRMRSRENILADVSQWLDDFNYLENILGDHKLFLLKDMRKCCKRNDPSKAAGLCRAHLDLSDTEPIHDICGLLEHAGIKVLPLATASDGFWGLSLSEEDGGPAILVNIWDRISVERRVFSAAHELAHLILHPHAYDVSKLVEDDKEETEANLFAGHFLMPDVGFRKEWNEAAGLHWVDRILKVKRIYRVSYKTILVRLLDHGVVDKSIWAKFNVAYQQRFHRKLSYKEEPQGIDRGEPFGLQRFDFYEDRFSRLTRQAVEEDKISLTRGAEMLRVSIEEMQDLFSSWEAVL